MTSSKSLFPQSAQIARENAWPARVDEVVYRGATIDVYATAAALTPEAAAPLVDALAVSVEGVDSRWVAEADVPPTLQLADFQVHGALVLGPWRPFGPWASHDWLTQAGMLQLGDEAPRPFRGSHPLGGPLSGLGPWLRHLTRHGQSVPAGTVVSTGSWSGCLPVARGTRVRLAFDGLGALTLAL